MLEVESNLLKSKSKGLSDMRGIEFDTHSRVCLNFQKIKNKKIEVESPNIIIDNQEVKYHNLK